MIQKIVPTSDQCTQDMFNACGVDAPPAQLTDCEPGPTIMEIETRIDDKKTLAGRVTASTPN